MCGAYYDGLKCFSGGVRPDFVDSEVLCIVNLLIVFSCHQLFCNLFSGLDIVTPIETNKYLRF